jgi:predicted transposase/invertase (TIGR01784 family)
LPRGLGGCITNAMARIFLDPKNDIVFKRIFAGHPEILRSLLNALLPLKEGGKIRKLTYLEPGQTPVLPLFKDSIVDVKCEDQHGRTFIVEMQINWTDAFLNRVLFNASKAYVHQLERGEQYHLLQPVTALSLLDDKFLPKSKKFYHHYQIVNSGEPAEVIDGLQFIFVELPKFKAGLAANEPQKQAWLRFLKELSSVETEKEAMKLKKELSMAAPEIGKAIDLTREASFTPAQLEAYDRYWDNVSRERTLMVGSFQEGHAVGHAVGGAERNEAWVAQLRAMGQSEEFIRKALEGMG